MAIVNLIVYEVPVNSILAKLFETDVEEVMELPISDRTELIMEYLVVTEDQYPENAAFSFV